MNRYPLWLYVTIAVALALGVLYTLPNFFGEAPAVQVSPARATLNMDNSALGRVEEALKKAGIAPTGTILDPNSVRVRLVDPDTQLRAKDVIERTLNPDPANPSYTVALNLLPNSPRWLAAVNALPMYLGLDLRGGVHFLLQVDMHAALVKQLDSDAGDIRTQLRDKTVRYVGIAREGDRILVRFRDADTRAKARGIIAERLPELQLADEGAGDDLRLVATVRPEAQKRNQDLALKQNIQTLHNRINELGVAEPVIQQQGADRVVVELPGVQDTTKAKEILGRTATLEVRLVDEDAQRRQHQEGLRLDDLRLLRARALHHDLLLRVRRVLDARAVLEPALAHCAPFDAPGDAHAPGHRGDRPHARHGDRRERAHQRARARGAEERRHPPGRDPRRLRAGLRHHPRLERHDIDRGPRAPHLRLGSRARLRRRALPGHPHLDLFLGGDKPEHGQPRLRLAQEARARGDRQHGLEIGGWNSSRSAATSRSCATRWRSTWCRSSLSCSRSFSSPPRA